MVWNAAGSLKQSWDKDQERTATLMDEEAYVVWSKSHDGACGCLAKDARSPRD